ncbi:MAG: hypothetical protein N2Z74_01900, partial [Syntrophales bacterium]|nr:hypothetical protein [Syntrophales bacterium]
VRHYLRGERLPPLLKNWFAGLLPVMGRTLIGVRTLSHFLVECLAGLPLPILRRFTALAYDEDFMMFTEGKRVALGYGAWEIIETPGHTADSLSLYSPLSGELLCGDLILNVFDDGRGTLNAFYENRRVIRETYERLCKTITARAIYPGHGDVIRGNGNVLEGVLVA